MLHELVIIYDQLNTDNLMHLINWYIYNLLNFCKK